MIYDNMPRQPLIHEIQLQLSVKRRPPFGAHHQITGEGGGQCFCAGFLFLVALGQQDLFLANAGIFRSGCTFA